jgi:CubicO group peptidase (beta-lactamase class C family)
MTVEVTTAATVSPDDGPVRALLETAATRVGPGRLPSCQLALARDGEILCFASLGAASNATRYLIYSATKPIVSSLLWQLMGPGDLEVSAPVAAYIPEFGRNGKGSVTVEHVLLHTAGLAGASMPRELWTDRAGRLERFGEWKLESEPGSAFAYHGNSAHWIQAELIERLFGADYRVAVNERILLPLGLESSSLGMPVTEQAAIDIPQVVSIGTRGAPEENLSVRGVRELPVPEVVDAHFLQYNTPEARAAGTPSSGCITTARDLALFYQALMRNDGSVWDDATLADAIGNVRNRLPVAGLGITASRALGVLVAEEAESHLRHLYGDTFSARAFGHTGAAGQVAWADPTTGVSFAFLTHALDADVMRQFVAQREVCAAAVRAAEALA